MNKTQVFKAAGILHKGFLGNITYGVALPENLHRVHVRLWHNKREAEDVAAVAAGGVAAIRENGCEGEITPDLCGLMSKMVKTEINVSVMLGDVVLGSLHKDMADKIFEISTEIAAEGFLPAKPAGVFQVILHVLCVLNDETQYTLAVEGEIV